MVKQTSCRIAWLNSAAGGTRKIFEAGKIEIDMDASLKPSCKILFGGVAQAQPGAAEVLPPTRSQTLQNLKNGVAERRASTFQSARFYHVKPCRRPD